jgi:threonine/homoserine/homoserine lactone efflux protein
VTGLAALLHARGVAFETLKYAGVGYLLYMAWSTWHETGTLGVPEDAGGSAWRVIRTGITINLLNPKLTVFFFAFLPQFVPPGTHHEVVRMLGLSGIFMALTFAVFVAYGALAAAVREHVLTRPRFVSRIRKVFAGTFVLLSGRLALESR